MSSVVGRAKLVCRLLALGQASAEPLGGGPSTRQRLGPTGLGVGSASVCHRQSSPLPSSSSPASAPRADAWASGRSPAPSLWVSGSRVWDECRGNIRLGRGGPGRQRSGRQAGRTSATPGNAARNPGRSTAVRLHSQPRGPDKLFKTSGAKSCGSGWNG